MEQQMKTASPLIQKYDEEYFERGVISGTSCYINYSWMPELSIRMAHFMTVNLPIVQKQKVLDYGCAKGFTVKALRLLGVDAYGVDISDYAISKAPTETKPYCSKISDVADPNCFAQDYDWLISKDVFEHIHIADLNKLLHCCREHVKKMFIVVPLSADDYSNKFIIPEYDRDVTHITIKTKAWWEKTFRKHGWTTERFTYEFEGIKESWTKAWPKGNAFFILS